VLFITHPIGVFTNRIVLEVAYQKHAIQIMDAPKLIVDKLKSKSSSALNKKTTKLSRQFSGKAQKDFLLMGIILFFFAFIILAIVK